MKMLAPPRRRALADHTFAFPTRNISDGHRVVPVANIPRWATHEFLRNRTILLATQQQLPSVLAAIELDGIARRILLATPDMHPHIASIVAEAQVNAIVVDDINFQPIKGVTIIYASEGNMVSDVRSEIDRSVETEWILFTSGTTGQPKMVIHTLSSLIGPLADGVVVPSDAVWSTFYDIRRYGGLTILLRALVGGGSMVLSDAQEGVSDFLRRLGRAGVTHISGTPSHWRRVLMSPAASAISPAYIRLSGEAVDQAILYRLQDHYRTASVAHAFASTEAGVGFDVRDGLAGFPVSFVPHPNNNSAIELRVEDGTLRIRSSRTASRYLDQPLPGSDGFIDTGDLVEQRDDRYYFLGRKEGVINVGGQKVYPEEIEEILTCHPDVLAARVWPRKNPVVGAIVAADLVLRHPTTDFDALTNSLRVICEHALAAFKVPATWRQVENISMTPSGKIQRA